MAHIKNSYRSKRKYTDLRKAKTERNRSLTPVRHELRMAHLVARTTTLIGKSVLFRTAANIKPRAGTVVDVVPAPVDAVRKGNYLVIRDSSGQLHTKSRSRVKPIKENNAV